MTELKYTEFLRFSLKDRIKKDIDDRGILDASEFDNLVCDLVLKTVTDESILNKDEMKYCIGIRIKHELDCNNKTISSLWDGVIEANEQQLS